MDLKLPCGGSLSILIDPQPDRQALLDAADAFAERQPVVLKFASAVDDSPVAFQYAPKTRIVLAGRGARPTLGMEIFSVDLARKPADLVARQAMGAYRRVAESALRA